MKRMGTDPFEKKEAIKKEKKNNRKQESKDARKISSKDNNKQVKKKKDPNKISNKGRGVNFYVDRKLLKEFKILSIAQGKSFSESINEAIRNYVKKYGEY